MLKIRPLALGALAVFTTLAACGGTGSSGLDTPTAGTGGTSSAGKGGTSSGGKGGGTSQGGDGQGNNAGTTPIDLLGGGGGSGPIPNGCAPTNNPDADDDKDGWTVGQGDCNDCDPNVNPGAVDVINYAKKDDGSQGEVLPDDQQVDEDCDGAKAPTSCDAGLGASVKDPFDAARAIGLCNVKVTEESRKWGVIDAVFSDIAAGAQAGGIKAQGKELDHAFGILPNFGDTSAPREGERLFAISSGIARAPGQPGWGEANVCSYDKGYLSGSPPGFPKNGTCGQTGAPHDGVALDLKIRVPTNAKSLRFKFRFFSCEYPDFACEIYNDVFAVLMSPSPLGPKDSMAYYAPDGSFSLANIAFEAVPDNDNDPNNNKKNVIGVNNQSFFTACEPDSNAQGYSGCKKGNGAQLKGSGFESHGGSAWLTTQVNAPPGGIIYLRFAIWDSQDGVLDSTAIIDAFEWSAEEGTGAVTVIDPDIQ